MHLLGSRPLASFLYKDFEGMTHIPTLKPPSTIHLDSHYGLIRGTYVEGLGGRVEIVETKFLLVAGPR